MHQLFPIALPARKIQSCQVIRVRHLHTRFNFHLMLIAILTCSKFEIIQLPREEL